VNENLVIIKFKEVYTSLDDDIIHDAQYILNLYSSTLLLLSAV